MKVRLRENNMAGQNKACREADREGNKPGTYFGQYGHISIYMYPLPMKKVVIGKRVNNDIKNSIHPSASKVAKGLGRYYTGKWPMKKIYYPNYDMSGLRKQMVKLAAKVRQFS